MERAASPVLVLTPLLTGWTIILRFNEGALSSECGRLLMPIPYAKQIGFNQLEATECAAFCVTSTQIDFCVILKFYDCCVISRRVRQSSLSRRASKINKWKKHFCFFYCLFLLEYLSFKSNSPVEMWLQKSGGKECWKTVAIFSTEILLWTDALQSEVKCMTLLEP